MLQKSSMIKTMEIFFINPNKEFYLMDISKTVGLAHTSIKQNLAKLLKLNLIIETIEKRGKRKFPYYKANLNNPFFKKYKSIYNLYSIIELGLIEFINEKATPKSIVLFGSFQKGEDIEESDIDLFIECMEEKIDLTLFEKRLKRKIELHFKEKFTSYPIELKNNIINGTVLSGFLEGYK